MAEPKPMKGVHLMLSQALLDWVRGTLEIVDNVYDANQNDENPEVIIKTLCMEHGFDYASDSFGKKAFKSTPYAANSEGGELRVTVVLVKKTNVLMLDLRPWGTYQGRWE